MKWRARANAFGFFTHRFQAGKLIQAASASFSSRKSALLRAMCEQINTVRSRIQTGSGFFCNSDVKEIPNAFALSGGHLGYNDDARGVLKPIDSTHVVVFVVGLHKLAFIWVVVHCLARWKRLHHVMPGFLREIETHLNVFGVDQVNRHNEARNSLAAIGIDKERLRVR